MTHNRIPQFIHKYTGHDMIQKHTELPAFPDSRIRLLVACLQASGIPSANQDLYASAVSLVQMGLDTHDLIDTHTGHQTEAEMRSRQIKVLGGDYFSSRFYFLLAQAGQVQMIRALSEAVCEVNHMKMDFYGQMKKSQLTADEYFECQVSIKSELFRSFTAIFDEWLSPQWNDLLSGISQCETAMKEWQRLNDSSLFLNSWAYWHLWHGGTDSERLWLAELGSEQAPDPQAFEALVVKYNIRSLLADKLHEYVTSTRAMISCLDSSSLVDELSDIVDTFVQALSAPALHSEMR
ncbi:heptaprenyl diphosphate synthase component 1 [Paenibacillus sp. MMS18-CY102]|uniref:heptaprenyl diphosphate synthase component 1 n=1 Tax=Paenibacillus sp. MMS18-CY102 TaxID=2682849 RepID=UPI00136629B6|nr:heptaprenyl diphosphate synthase component 1 [Paenibacillus sp. MMS18-CY102]MWC28464.1 heptaprenyl diphosphate synthase [Paenibacillus sp. MMS18-CY102]